MNFSCLICGFVLLLLRAGVNSKNTLCEIGAEGTMTEKEELGENVALLSGKRVHRETPGWYEMQAWSLDSFSPGKNHFMRCEAMQGDPSLARGGCV